MVDQMTEVERKYDVAPEVRTPDLSELPGVVHVDPPLDLEQVATYFDTADLRLLAARMTLRHRTGGVDDGWHLKVPARDEGREEIHLAASGSDEPPEPPAALLDRVRGVMRDNPVTPVAVLRTRRRLVRLHGKAGVLAEFCDDHVAAESPMEPSLTQEWREWEMELVQGSDRAADGCGALASRRRRQARCLGLEARTGSGPDGAGARLLAKPAGAGRGLNDH